VGLFYVKFLHSSMVIRLKISTSWYRYEIKFTLISLINVAHKA